MWLLLLLTGCTMGQLIREPPPPLPRTRAVPVEGWTSVRLNHFDASNTDTFQMRYYYNNEFATTNNVVIYVGGEWEISPSWVTGGLAHELAEDLKAGLIYTEHRYYGQTRPTSGTSTSELRFLNVDQALGDLAQFIQHVQSEHFDGGKFRGGKVALVGCSYAGSMATWMKMGYPHLVTAAFSDSGPLQAQENFPEYMEVVTEALRHHGSEECVTSISEAAERALAMMSDGRTSELSEMFQTCGQINGTNMLDVTLFSWWSFIIPVAATVQHAGKGDIAAMCNALTDTTEPDALRRMASYASAVVLPWMNCIPVSYEQNVVAHMNTSYDSPDSENRIWMYQTCVEYGWYQTTTSERQPFHSMIPLEYFHQMCKDFFGESFDEELLRKGIERSNLFWGGRRSMPDGVITVAGGLDPWAPMGPYSEHGTPLAPVYVVPEVSHCRAIRSTSDSETEELGKIKLAVLQGMQDLMEGRPPYISAATITSITTSLVLVISILLLIIGHVF